MNGTNHLFILMIKLFHIWPVRAFSTGSCVLLTCPINVGGCPFFLAVQGIPNSLCIFPALTLTSVISTKTYGPFLWRIVLRNQDLGIRCVYCYKDVIASRYSQWKEVENMHKHVYKHEICFYFYICFSVNVCIYTIKSSVSP